MNDKPYIESLNEIPELVEKEEDINVKSLSQYSEVRDILLNMAEYAVESGWWNLFGKLKYQIDQLDEEWGKTYKQFEIDKVVRVPLG